MKKLIALTILATTLLSGCAVYPVGYTNYGYREPYSAVYVDPVYVAPAPSIWINNGWGGRGYYGGGGGGYRRYH